MVAGDDGCEACTTIAQSARSSLDIPDIAEAEAVGNPKSIHIVRRPL
jgi:hypothetical protein